MKHVLITEGFLSDEHNDTKYAEGSIYLVVYANKKFCTFRNTLKDYKPSDFINIDDERGWDLSMQRHFDTIKE